MRVVYEAQNVVDAQLLCDRLQESGIDANISGSYLGGAAGEVPVDSLVRVWVEKNTQYAQARKLVQEFESSLHTPAVVCYCRACGEQSTSKFTHCWSCGAALT